MSGTLALSPTPARERLVAAVAAAVARGAARGLRATSVYLSALDAREAQLTVAGAAAVGDPPRVLGLPVRLTAGRSRVYAAGGIALAIPPLVANPAAMTHYWRIKTNLPERRGQPCRVTARGALNSCEIEFADGTRHVVSRFAVRKLPA